MRLGRLVHLLVSVVVCFPCACTPPTPRNDDNSIATRQAKAEGTKQAFHATLLTRQSQDFYPLAAEGDNTEAYSWLCRNPIRLVPVAGGGAASLTDLKNTAVIFGTHWEPSSAKKFGKLKKAMDSGEARKFAVVFIEGTAEQIREAKRGSWYLESAYVLGDDSNRFPELVRRVPFTVILDSQGAIQAIEEGV